MTKLYIVVGPYSPKALGAYYDLANAKACMEQTTKLATEYAQENDSRYYDFRYKKISDMEMCVQSVTSDDTQDWDGYRLNK